MRKVKIDSELYFKVSKRASELKYGSVEEYITHLLERDLDMTINAKSDDTIKNRLKGLGYF